MGARPRVELHDPGLTRRMALTLFLLAVVYGCLIAALLLSGVAAMVVFGIAAIVVALQLMASDRLLLRAIGAREANPPELQAAVHRACMLADMPEPRVMVVRTAMPNALAVGRTRGDATLCVTTEMLRALDPPELEAVVAHELAH